MSILTIIVLLFIGALLGYTILMFMMAIIEYHEDKNLERMCKVEGKNEKKY